ncbi:MAG: N-acetylmuramoyl-L-alanine amidase [Candidatus Moranbacteria bacterium]|nr:N-acetylmuramoyl-L-alanine amidase [Candidatus Moranbacteria bacterium]
MPSKRSLILGTLLITAATGALWLYERQKPMPPSASEYESLAETVEIDESSLHPRLRGLNDWKRPDGPWHVAIQVGHLQASDAPDELEKLRINTGTSYGKVTEWETSLAIAEKTKTILEASGIAVEILPTTIPPNHWSDIFISIHTDGNENASVSGYKVASPRRDYTGKSEEFAATLGMEYQDATSLPFDDNITKAMRGYYAFNWRRYDHSIHPETVAAIIETGFLTNARARSVIVKTPEIPAQGIASGILSFLASQKK